MKRSSSPPPSTPSKRRKTEDGACSFAWPQKSVYARARSALRLSVQSHDQVLGRDAQQRQLYDFVSRKFPTVFPFHDACNNTRVDSLCISGRPGTGKTLLIHALLQEPMQKGAVQGIILNCTAIHDLYATVLGAMLHGTAKVKGEKARIEIEKQAKRPEQKPFLLVLDEADHLADGSALPFFYQLSAQPDSKLSLIAVANTLDIASKLSISSYNARSIEFPPYTSTDMSLIAKQRLLSISDDGILPCIVPPALELAAKRVAGVSGDLRTFLSVLRKTIEMAEPPASSSPSPEGVASTPKATPSTVLKALKACALSAVHNPSSAVEQALENATLHARIVLACFCISIGRLETGSPRTKSSKPASVPLDSAWTVYNEALQGADKELMGQARSDYESLVDTLHVLGLVSLETITVRQTPSPLGKSKSRSPRSKACTHKQRCIQLVHPLALTMDAVKRCQGETAAVMEALFCSEARKQKKRLKLKEWDEAAPMSGFHGDGLEGQEADMLGKAARGRNVDEEPE